MLSPDQKYSVLLVEDDPDIGDATRQALECFEFNVRHVQDGQSCFQAVQQHEPKLILLDLELPGLMGHHICQTLREGGFKKGPIIVLSGCQDEDAIVKVLECGADDFVPKSQAIPILLAHIRAVLRRGDRLSVKEDHANKIVWGPIKLDLTSWKITISGAEVEMTPTEARLLETFISAPGVVFTRGQLIDRMHGAGYVITPRTIDVHINGLRSNLGEHRSAIETVRGVGYRFAETPK